MTVLDRFRLDGKTALITGGSRGLGRAMAQALMEAGADLVLVGRETTTLAEAQQSLSSTGRTVITIAGDVSTPEGATRACDEALSLGRSIDILVNNVGGRRQDTPTEDVPLIEWQKLFDLNFTSALICCQRIGKTMLQRQQGSIINITSVAGPIAIKGIRGRHYETAKSALTALTKSLAADWANSGVRVNAIAPGVFETEPNKRWFGMKPEFKQSFVDHIPMGRLGQPDELGAAAVFLASEASSYITGSTLLLDGGYTLW